MTSASRERLRAGVTTYRPPDEVEQVVKRLVANDITWDQLSAAIGGSLEAASAALRVEEIRDSRLTTDELVCVALLAEERGAALRADITASSRIRYAAIQAAAHRDSIVELARRFGVSRQKISQIVNDSDVAAITDDTLSYMLRKIRGER